MKKILIASLALFLSLSAFSQTSGVGIGATLGTNFDFTAKFWMSEKTAFALFAGLDFGNYNGFHVGGDFLFHNWSWAVGQDQMMVYFGPGLELGVHPSYSSSVSMAIRGASGLGYYFHNIPLECFVDLVPMVEIFGPNGFYYDWGSYIGARWYF